MGREYVDKECVGEESDRIGGCTQSFANCDYFRRFVLCLPFQLEMCRALIDVHVVECLFTYLSVVKDTKRQSQIFSLLFYLSHFGSHDLVG